MYPLCYCGLWLDTADCIVVDDGGGGGLGCVLGETNHSKKIVVQSKIGEFFSRDIFLNINQMLWLMQASKKPFSLHHSASLERCV